MRKIRSARHRGVLFRAKSYKFLDSLRLEMNFTEEIAPDKGIEVDVAVSIVGERARRSVWKRTLSF